MHSIQLFLLSICLLIFSTRNQCSIPKTDQSKIKSGQFTLQADEYINKSSTHAYELLYKEPFRTEPAIAFGINGFDVAGQHVSGLDIKVGKNSCTKAKFQISFKSSSNWNSIQVNFMATNRPDIQIGSVGYSGFVVDKTVQLKYAFQKKWSKQITLKYKIFLSSFKIKTNQQNTLRISLQKSQTTLTSLDMAYYVPSSLTEIQEISVSVILFDSMNPSFRYSEGVISQTYIQSIYSIQINKQDVSELKTYMIGLTSFDVSVGSTSTSSINIYSNMNDNFILHVGTDNQRNGKGSQCQVKYVMVSYLVLSVYPQCGACLTNYVKFDDKCVDKCPLGYFPKLGKCERQTCSKGSYLSPTLNKCQKCPKFSNIKQCQNPCPIGTTLEGQQCNLICPSQKEIYSYNICICKSGFYRIGTQCKKCVQGTQYDYSKQNCVSICQQNSRYLNQSGKCVCLDNYQSFGGKCIKCDSGEVFDVAWGCRVKCGDFMEFDGFSCKCVKGYYKKDGNCVKCGDGLAYDDSKKACVSRCQSTQVWQGNRCVCAKDYYKVKGLCKKCLETEQYDSKNQNCRPKCLNGQVLINNKCQCLSQSYLIGGSCQTCPAETQYSKDSNKCQNICKKNYEKFSNGKCVCFEGYYRQNGECIPTKCPQNSNYDSTSETCLCLPPYSFNQKTSKCLLPPACPQHSSLKNNICTCEQNFYMKKDKSQCVKCDTDTNEIFNGQSCQCKQGYVRNIRQVCVKIVLPQCRRNQRYNAQGRICQCVDGFEKLGGDCMKVEKCKENQYFNGMECVCESGYFKKQGSAVCKKVAVEEPKCPYNSKFNGQKCVCNQNFFQISPGICGTCPYNMSWNGRKCAYGKQCWTGYQWDEKTQCCKPIGDHQCPENSKWNGNACECNEEYYSIDGLCKKCEQDQKYNGTDCQKSQDQKQKECIGVNRILINGSCVCKANTHEYNGKCIQCDYPTVWNGQYCQGNTNSCFTVPNSIMDPTTKRCKCKDGFRGVNGKCVAIPGYLHQNGTIYRWADGYRWAGPNIDYQKQNAMKDSQANQKKKQNGNSKTKDKGYQDYYTSNGIKIRISSNSDLDKQNKNNRNNIDYTSNIQYGSEENGNNHIDNEDQNDPDSNGNIINGPNNEVDGYRNNVNGEGNDVIGEGNVIYGSITVVDKPSEYSNTNSIPHHPTTDTIIYPNYGNIDTAPGTNQINGQGNIVDGKGNSINGQGNIVQGDGNIITGYDGTIQDFFMPSIPINLPINLPQYLASIPTSHKNQQLDTSTSTYTYTQTNKVDGNGNTIYGTNNKVAGDDNQINGDNIFVFGSGNQVY